MTEKKHSAEYLEYRRRLSEIINRHVGVQARIGAAELFAAVFGYAPDNKINATRALRSLVTDLRKDGIPIISSTASDGGYYLSSAGSDLEAFCKRFRSRALNTLKIEARLRKITLPTLLGQIAMSFATPKEDVTPPSQRP